MEDAQGRLQGVTEQGQSQVSEDPRPLPALLLVCCMTLEFCFLICLVEIIICALPTSQSHHEEGKTMIAKVPKQH